MCFDRALSVSYFINSCILHDLAPHTFPLFIFIIGKTVSQRQTFLSQNKSFPTTTNSPQCLSEFHNSVLSPYLCCYFKLRHHRQHSKKDQLIHFNSCPTSRCTVSSLGLLNHYYRCIIFRTGWSHATSTQCSLITMFSPFSTSKSALWNMLSLHMFFQQLLT